MKEARKNNILLLSTLDYFVFYVPFILILVFAFNKLFYMLFNFEISYLFRPYSFWWIIFDLLFQSNIEFFTFLSIRNFQTFYTYDISDKGIMILTIMIFFLTFLSAFSSYLIYYAEYDKLAKYFLCNLFRFKSSYILMTIMYGARPFMKGIVHAIFYYNWELQITMLISVEAFILILVLFFEFNYDSHKSKPAFMMDIGYYSSLIILNGLLLCKYSVFEK